MIPKGSIQWYDVIDSTNSEVRRLLDINKAERHIRGGMATKRKYELSNKK